MKDVKDIIKNIEHVYDSNNSLNILKDFERVIDELDTYVYDNWIDGELIVGPNETRYFVECVFMWPYDKMPEPRGGMALVDYGCRVQFGQDKLAKVRKIEKPDDIRPGTKKGKIDLEDVWLVKIAMPKKLMHDISRGYTALDRNKVDDMIAQSMHVKEQDPVEEQSQEVDLGDLDDL